MSRTKVENEEVTSAIEEKETSKQKKIKTRLRDSATRYNVKLHFTSPILGSAPANRDIYAKFVATKKADSTEETRAAESDFIPEPIPFDDATGKMIFRVDPSTQAKIFLPHQIKGFLKQACKCVLGKEITAYRSKIDDLVHVRPDVIPLKKNGQITTMIDGLNERPLRAQTPQGPRVTLVSSEELTDCEVEFVVEVLPLGTKDFDLETLDYIFQYGEFSGISQWRNAGYGRFTFEITPIE
jgi:hypothetical protein